MTCRSVALVLTPALFVLGSFVGCAAKKDHGSPPPPCVGLACKDGIGVSGGGGGGGGDAATDGTTDAATDGAKDGATDGATDGASDGASDGGDDAEVGETATVDASPGD